MFPPPPPPLIPRLLKTHSFYLFAPTNDFGTLTVTYQKYYKFTNLFIKLPISLLPKNSPFINCRCRNKAVVTGLSCVQSDLISVEIDSLQFKSVRRIWKDEL
jgi:hypothetical protein